MWGHMGELFEWPLRVNDWGRRTRLWPASLDDLPRTRRLKDSVRWLTVAFIVVVVLIAGASSARQPATLIALASLAMAAVFVGFDFWPLVRNVALGAAFVAIAISPTTGLTTASTLAVVCFVLVISRPVWIVIRLLPAFGVVYVLLMLLTGHDAASSVDDAVLTLTPAIGASVFLTSIVRNVERADLLHEDRVRTEVAGSFESAAQAASDSIRQVLHDRVLGALSLVQHHDTEQRERVASYCGQVADGIQGRPPPDDPLGCSLRSVIDDVCSDVDLDIRKTLAPGGLDDALEPSTAAALRRALGEALRNCEQHSGSMRVEIRHESSGSVSSLVVRDEGTGFAEQPMGWGIANSISSPLVGIGGAAHIHSTPGDGTTVTLTWPAATASTRLTPVQATYRYSSQAIGEVAALSMIVVPLLLANGYIAVRYSLGDSTAGAQLALAACSVVATFLLCARLLRQGPSPMTIAGIVLTSTATVALGLWLAEPANALTTYDSWCVGLAAVGPFVLAYFLPLSWLPLVIAPNLLLVAFGIRQGDEVTIANSLGAFNAALLPLYASICGAALRAVERALERDLSLLASASERLEVRQHSEAGNAQLRFLEHRIAPWLREVAGGTIPLEDPNTAHEAQLLGHEARDTLNLPGVLDDTLRSRITTLRRSGLTVNLVPGDGASEDNILPTRLLDRVLDQAATLDSVLVFFPKAGASMLTVAPELTPADIARMTPCLGTVKFAVENDGLSTTITFGHAYRERTMRQQPVG